MNAKMILELINQGKQVNIIDIRARERYEAYHLPTAIWIEQGQLLADPAKFLDKSKSYWVACNSGNSAQYVALILSNEGYDIKRIEGGMASVLAK